MKYVEMVWLLFTMIYKNFDMEAPNKIYIHEVSATELALPVKEYHIEYIRKDLLLEWAKELTSEPYDRTTVSALKHQIAHYLLEKYDSL